MGTKGRRDRYKEEKEEKRDKTFERDNRKKGQDSAKMRKKREVK